jgi:hypothetical protein
LRGWMRSSAAVKRRRTHPARGAKTSVLHGWVRTRRPERGQHRQLRIYQSCIALSSLRCRTRTRHSSRQRRIVWMRCGGQRYVFNAKRLCAFSCQICQDGLWSAHTQRIMLHEHVLHTRVGGADGLLRAAAATADRGGYAEEHHGRGAAGGGSATPQVRRAVFPQLRRHDRFVRAAYAAAAGLRRRGHSLPRTWR